MSESKQQKSSKPNFELPTHRAPNPEEVERYIKERPELSRPFILPNHQKHLVAVTWLSCAGSVIADFQIAFKLLNIFSWLCNQHRYQLGLSILGILSKLHEVEAQRILADTFYQFLYKYYHTTRYSP